MESVAAERLNKIGIRDHNITNGSASENENTSAGKSLLFLMRIKVYGMNSSEFMYQCIDTSLVNTNS